LRTIVHTSKEIVTYISRERYQKSVIHFWMHVIRAVAVLRGLAMVPHIFGWPLAWLPHFCA